MKKKKRSIYWPILNSITEKLFYSFFVLIAGTSISIKDSATFSTPILKNNNEKGFSVTPIIMRSILKENNSKLMLKRLFNENFFKNFETEKENKEENIEEKNEKNENENNEKKIEINCWDDFCNLVYSKLKNGRYRIYSSLIYEFLDSEEGWSISDVVYKHYNNILYSNKNSSFNFQIELLKNKYNDIHYGILSSIIYFFFFNNGKVRQQKESVDLMSYGFCILESVTETEFNICEEIIVDIFVEYFRKK